MIGLLLRCRGQKSCGPQRLRIAFHRWDSDLRSINLLGAEMLLNPSALEEQLSHPVEDAVREAYLAFARARVPEGMTVRPAGHGYIARELRFESDGAWFFSAVLNQKWVLWYFRKPAINAGFIQADRTRASFPAAETSERGEIKLRVRNAEDARAVLNWIGCGEVL